MWCFGRPKKKTTSSPSLSSIPNSPTASSSPSPLSLSSSLSPPNSLSSSITKGFFQLSIPDEVKLIIFSYLSLNELCKLSYVSKDIRALSLDDGLWMSFFVKMNPAVNPVLDRDEHEPFIPPARVCHSAVIHGERMYIFGGHIPDPLNYIRDVKSDCCAFHFPTHSWEPILPSPKGEPFPSKTEHTAVVHQNTMYLFGGYSNSTTGYSDVDIYAFNFDTRICERVNATGNAPTDRSAHTAVVYQDSMYVLGGWDGDVSNNDFHAFHFPTRVWSRVAYTGFAPPSVRSHATVVFKDTMLVFGGYGEQILHPTSLYIFHFLEGRWEEISFDVSPTSSSLTSSLSSSSISNVGFPSSPKQTFTGPCGRSRFRMVYYQESLWVFGGWDRQSYFADLWRFRIDKKVWHKVDASFDLQGVGQHSLVVNQQGYMYLYGGYCPVAKAPHPHLYAFRLPQPRNAEA